MNIAFLNHKISIHEILETIWMHDPEIKIN